MSWVQTASGKAVDLLAPCLETICEQDIALHLSRLCRFSGATRFPYSVAQHSLHVLSITRAASPDDVDAHLWSLLHDAHEAFTGDVTSPMQRAVAAELGWSSSGLNVIARIQSGLDRAIAARFGISWSAVEAVKPLVHRADMIALSTEKAQLMAKAPRPWDIDLPPPDDVELQQISASAAEFLFRSNLERCLDALHGRRATAAE